jgi:Uncharacterized protein conserved in bacteria
MSDLARIRLYVDTVRHLKLSQIGYRLWRSAGFKTPLRWGYRPQFELSGASIDRVPVLAELDFDASFLGRFDTDALMEDRVALLHHEEHVDWLDSWQSDFPSPLWGYNFHYCEYLLPLAHAALESGSERYVNKAKTVIDGWIRGNPLKSGGMGWDSYVISMRVTSWLSWYGDVSQFLGEDVSFVGRMNVSLAEQYVHLAAHLEKDLLANHYLENLKALVLLSVYFDDGETLKRVLPLLDEQIEEQILPDGMHFERSPMYHKVMLESLLRVACTLRRAGAVDDAASWCRLVPMCDCLHSLERHTSRTPLFGDAGDNVSKGQGGLLACARSEFGIVPQFQLTLPEAGYVILEAAVGAASVKIVFNAGGLPPGYASGHVHCDLLSFEAFVDGAPWLVNSGTFAYQGDDRLAFKRTKAHNAPQYRDVEQSECWAPFRVARMARPLSVRQGKNFVEAEIMDHCGNRIERRLEITGVGVRVVDRVADGAEVVSVVHVAEPFGLEGHGAGARCVYAPDFGRIDYARAFSFSGKGQVEYQLSLSAIVASVEREGGC